MRASDYSSPMWDDSPPASNPVWYPIYYAKPGFNIQLAILSNHMIGVWTHWHLNRTVPCFGVENGCICGREKLSRRWKGYLACYDPRPERSCLAELTRDAVKLCQVELGNEGPDLRGKSIRLFRIGKKENSPARVEVWQGQLDIDPSNLPPAFDVKLALLNLWNGLSK